MRRPRSYRALVAVWGIWFTAVLSDPGGLHSCPTHGDHAMHASHDAMDATVSHTAPASSDTDGTQRGPKACTCLGQCCCGAPVAPPAPGHEILVAATIDVPAHEHADVSIPVTHRAYAHPFAHGPPAHI